jgi:hypothetical protein
VCYYWCWDRHKARLGLEAGEFQTLFFFTVVLIKFQLNSLEGLGNLVQQCNGRYRASFFVELAHCIEIHAVHVPLMLAMLGKQPCYLSLRAMMTLKVHVRIYSSTMQSCLPSRGKINLRRYNKAAYGLGRHERFITYGVQ